MGIGASIAQHKGGVIFADACVVALERITT